MMNRFRTFILAGILAGVLLAAPSASAADPSVVGIVNYNEVISQSNEGKRVNEELAAFIKEKQTAMDAKKQLLEQMRADYKSQELTLAAEAKKTKELEYQHLFKDYQQAAAMANEEVNKKRAELRAKVLGEIYEIVRTVGQEGKYTMIIDSSAVSFCQKEADITLLVIERYNKIKK